MITGIQESAEERGFYWKRRLQSTEPEVLIREVNQWVLVCRTREETAFS